MDSVNLPKYGKNKKMKFDEQTPFWTRVRYKIFSMYFLTKVLWILFRVVLLVGISYVILLPYFTKVAGSFMGKEDFVDVTVKLIPKNFTLRTYKAIINDNHYWRALLNSAILAVTLGVVQMVVCAIIGYGFSKFKFRGRGILFACVVLTMIIPHKTLQSSFYLNFRFFDIVGIFNLVKKITGTDLRPNLLNTPWPYYILSFTGLAFRNGLFIFIMRQFYKGVPDELEEAAYVDGAGVIKTFIRIIIPMSVPMMVTIFLFAFSWQWTDTFYSGLFLPNQEIYLLPKIVTIPKSLDTTFIAQGTYEAAIRNTSALLIIVPLVIVYLFGQKSFVEGIERSGVTG